MTFPALVGSPVASGVNSGPLSATLPASRTANNILRATVFWNARTTAPAAPAGWAYVPAVGGGDAFVSANGGCLAIFARVASNTSADALALPSGGAISAVVEQITDPGGFGLAGLIATMISDWAGTGNPPSLATGWSGDNLFTAVQGLNTDSVAQNSWPATYELGRASSFNGGLWGRASVASAQIAAATDDPPGAFQAFGDGVNNLLGTTAVRGTAAPGPVLTGDITTDPAAPTGTLQSNPPSTLTGNITTDAAAPTGGISSGAAPGTVVLSGWDNLAGMPLPSTSVARITMQRLSDGVQVLNLPGLTTSADLATPVISITNAALVAGTFYLAIANNADGTVLGVERVQAV